jgi:hypothetical protein
MIIKTKHWSANLTLASTILAISVCGCSAMAPFSGASNKQSSAQTPPPFVQNCGIVSIGSPSNYACNGKVYTSFQLTKLREDWEKSHGG